MWPFGKKQISTSDATVEFYGKVSVIFEQNYEAILELLRNAYEDDCPFEEVVYMEVIPAVWAMGIEPVQHLWGEAQFNRVRAEMLVLIDRAHQPMTKPLVERFLKHTQLLRAGLANDTATSNSDHILRELGLSVQPMVSLRLSTQLAMLVLPYWKDLQRTHRLY
jgi:hypothetical protein